MQVRYYKYLIVNKTKVKQFAQGHQNNNCSTWNLNTELGISQIYALSTLSRLPSRFEVILIC